MKPEKEHKSKRKKEKKLKKSKRSQEKLLDHLNLLSLAQLGDNKEVEDFLRTHGNKAINMYDSDGSTPLHQVNTRRNIWYDFSGKIDPCLHA